MLSLRRALLRVAFFLAAASSAACGGNAGPHPTSPSELGADQIDADPLALLPPGAFVVASVDARSFYASGSVGAQVAELSERVVPIGDEAGFKASRDVDRVYLGSYSAEGLDVSAVLLGRFDEAKIAHAAEAHTQTRAGGLIVKSTYAGRAVYTVADVGFSILTAKTALVGTQTGIRRALDRIRDGRPKRDILPWVQETIDTPGAAATLSVDLTQPMAAAAIATLPVSGWAKGASRARFTGDFAPPGMHVAGKVTYADAPGASEGARGIKQVATMANLVALTGLVPRLGDLDIHTADADVLCAFTVDDHGLQGLASSLAKYVQ